jgi:D-alanyl-D-alanine carboxypeptidase/D-alanyl-D-alanine-endopeptidase (penicillin-binding protein 4)
MHHWLGQAGPDTGAYIYDLTTGKAVYGLRADTGRPPASVEKIYTTVALLDELGPDARMRTEVLGSGQMGAHGVWHGDLYLRGGGDPTFGSAGFNQVWAGGIGARIEDLVDQLIHHVGIRRVTGHVIADASLFDSRMGGPGSGYKPDVPDYGGELSALIYNHGSVLAVGRSPAVFAAQQLAAELRSDRVPAYTSKRPGQAPPDTNVLASVQSPRLADMLRLMDVPSDDLYAEMLTEQLGARLAGSGTVTAGANEIAAALSQYGIHPHVVDGSGLSHDNRSSPLEVVKLLTDVWGTWLGRELDDALPVVGQSGTVRGLAVGTRAAGHCVAKTGTLDYVTNLAGYCESASRQMLAFAFFIDGPGNWQATQLLGHMVADMVRIDVTRP